ncbi:hypothetical protein HMPREF9248_0040 [Fannyhessea vaginae PB189-T1-4]|uniref:Uncharacterized protein n=1 Tax=Fannyhessea vaginae PB189-T1-4 TaxID=866774 RepID=A0ABN0B1F9_9ACTN|nr:hypothetical protein HMPREF9248_0040 [Fannyhessea vaginae PB189-T1-4]
MGAPFICAMLMSAPSCLPCLPFLFLYVHALSGVTKLFHSY